MVLVWARMALSTCPLTSDLIEDVHRKGIVSFQHLSHYLRRTFGDLMAKDLLKNMYKVNSTSWICELLSEHIEVRRSEGHRIIAIRDPYAGKDSLAAITSPTDVPHTLSMTKLKEFLLATIKRKGYMMFEDLSDYCWNEYGFALNAKNLQPLFGCRQSYKDILESLLEGQLGIIGARKDSSNEDAYTDIYTLYWTGDMDPSEQKKSTKTKATQTNRNMADKLANFLQENGGISVMVILIPSII
uniref:Aldo_ket_red domain-containing protein n=1 Tax=Steinernema glaseri TaxID=37863 RepID=A0A1I7ZQJ7_9BILA